MDRTMAWLLGSDMTAELKRQALRHYVNRYTRDHKPDWVLKDPRKQVPVQFSSDQEWLDCTWFPVTRRNALGPDPCRSTPTYPDGK